MYAATQIEQFANNVAALPLKPLQFSTHPRRIKAVRLPQLNGVNLLTEIQKCVTGDVRTQKPARLGNLALDRRQQCHLVRRTVAPWH
jgi:hypothetical protein